MFLNINFRNNVFKKMTGPVPVLHLIIYRGIYIGGYFTGCI